MLFAEERERRVVAGACDVCSTWIARVVRVSPVLDGHRFWRREGKRLVFTLDALQLAIALDLHRLGNIAALVAADKRLCRVSSLAGCAAINPEQPSPILI
jgi:predicted nucleic acid-binding protein